MKPLRGGLKLDGKKEATLITWKIARPAPPRRVRIPLTSVEGPPAAPRVRVGDRVRVGEIIAEPADLSGAALHASISGTVSQIERLPHPILGESEAIEIVSDGKDETLPGLGHERPNWESLSSQEIAAILRESGIGLVSEIAPPPLCGGGVASPRPAPPKLRRSGGLAMTETRIDTVILNGCESEPYLTSDHALLMSHPAEILRAGEILARTWEAKELIVAVEDNKEEVAELLKSKLFFHPRTQTRIEVLPSRYPQEEPSILVRELLGRDLEPGEPVSEAGAAVVDIARAYAVYEAVVLQKPFYERAVTIAGECIAQPKNLWIRLGTLVEEAVKYAHGFLREPARVIDGGPMTGFALERLDVPILKGTRAILGLPPEVARPEAVEPCIRCGECIENCPVSISPVMITLASEKNLWGLAQDYGLSRCIECGNCAYVCPAKRPMVELIQKAKRGS